jgi:MFS family permease
MAIIPTYAAIGIAAPILAVLARMLQGFSLGGEIGSTTAFLLEAAPLNKRGLIVAWQNGSQLIALVAGGSIGALLTLIFPASALDAFGWRIAFLLGFMAVPFGLWLRSHLPETLHLPEPVAAAPVAPQSRLDQLRSHWRPMVLGLTILGSCTIANYIALYIVTYTQNTLHMSARLGFIAATSGNVLSIPSVLLGGWLSDRYGRWPVNTCGNLAFLLLIYPMFYWIVATRSPLALILSMTVLAITANFMVGSFQAGLAESLPKTIRGSGFGTVYSVAIAAFGGTTQLVVTWLIHVTGSAMAPAWYVMGAAAIGQIAIMLLPESAPVRSRLNPAIQIARATA